MSIRRGNVILAGAGGSANPDEVTINLNSSDKLQALGTINKNLSSDTSAIYNWIGTLEEYNTQNVETLHPEWVCYITDDSDPANSTTGIEIGDIGIAAFGIDETQNLRRYLNGQVISQTQFQSFTDKIKSISATYSNIITTEENWQAEVTNSKLGQCGKFVIDNVAGTIRLPKVVNINGLQDLTGLGGIKAESLPNIKGRLTSQGWRLGDATPTGPFYREDTGGERPGYGTSGGSEWYFDASRSSSTYQDNAPVQQEAIQYPYFIQVATGVETSIDVSREIELNNPFSLLDYKYSEYELSNASWLLSNGQWNSGAVYQSVYNLLLQIYNGTTTKAGVSVKLSTETYTDTDFVLNTTDTTFRLPLKVALASGKAVAGNGMSLGLTNGTTNGGLQSNTTVHLYSESGSYGHDVSTKTSSGAGLYGNLGVTTDPEKSGIETSANGLYLYFYVGEVVQDANIIAAGQALTDIADLKAHSIVETYQNGDNWYRIYSDGWCEQGGIFDRGSDITSSGGFTITLLKGYNNTLYTPIVINGGNSSGGGYGWHIAASDVSKTATSFSGYAWKYETSNRFINWETKGYIS